MYKRQVDELLTDDKFSVSGGLPEPLRRGGDPEAMMRETVRYHLAELDWRRAANLRPPQRTPADAHGEIDARSVPLARVSAVIADLSNRPAFMYFAGGEASYAIAWSERERAFVRIHACC